MAGNQPVIKPIDAISWVFCIRRVWLDNKLSAIHKAELAEFDHLVVNLGVTHEQNILTQLSTQHRVQAATSVKHTKTLMEESVDVIYQAADAKSFLEVLLTTHSGHSLLRLKNNHKYLHDNECLIKSLIYVWLHDFKTCSYCYGFNFDCSLYHSLYMDDSVVTNAAAAMDKNNTSY